MFEELLELSRQDDFDKQILERWAASTPSKDLNGLINDFALSRAHQFLEGRLDFWTANGSLNCVMAVLEFEAPAIFWEVAVTFEDFEVSEDPEHKARAKVKELLQKITGEA